MEEKESFIFYRSFYNAIHKLKDKTKRCDLYEAIFELGLNNEDVKLDDEVGDMILELIKPQIRANTKRYEDGRKGGAPIGNKNASKNKNSTETTKNNLENNLKQLENNQNNHRLNQKQPNVNDNVNVNKNVNVNANVEKENKKEKTTTTTEIKNLALINFYEEHFGRTVSKTEVDIIETWEDTELTRYAIKEAELARAFNIKYVQRILLSYKEKNIQTVAEAEESQKRFHESKTTVKNKFDKLEEEKQKFYEAQNDS